VEVGSLDDEFDFEEVKGGREGRSMCCCEPSIQSLVGWTIRRRRRRGGT